MAEWIVDDVLAPAPGVPFQLGTIVHSEQIEPEDVGVSASLAPASIVQVEVADPYIDLWPSEHVLRGKALEEGAAELAETRRLAGFWDRAPGGAYIDNDVNTPLTKAADHWGDPVASQAFFSHVGSPAAEAWKRLIPSAQALLYLSDPLRFPSVVEGEYSYEIDLRTRLMWSIVSDAVGIRSRSAVMASLCTDSLSTATGTVKWLSIACGTALPAMQALVTAELPADLMLIDWDKKSLEMAKEIAQELGVQGTLTTQRMNIFDNTAMAQLGDTLVSQSRSPALIDMMGIFEYTGENLGVDSSTFLASAWNLLQPEGTVILGQMRSDRPLADFAMGVIQWPYIQMRSINELLQVIADAGIATSACRVYLPSDGVYTVVAIKKP
jgi:hypothetical protein